MKSCKNWSQETSLGYYGISQERSFVNSEIETDFFMPYRRFQCKARVTVIFRLLIPVNSSFIPILILCCFCSFSFIYLTHMYFVPAMWQAIFKLWSYKHSPFVHIVYDQEINKLLEM